MFYSLQLKDLICQEQQFILMGEPSLIAERTFVHISSVKTYSSVSVKHEKIRSFPSLEPKKQMIVRDRGGGSTYKQTYVHIASMCGDKHMFVNENNRNVAMIWYNKKACNN